MVLSQALVKAKYDYYNWHIWCGDTCMDHKRAARHWQGFRDRTQPYIAIAKSHIKTGGTTIDTEFARAKLHLKWAKMEKRWADSMEHIVKTQYRTGEYVDEAERTVSTAYAELVWAEDSVRNVRKAINTRNAVEALQYKVRQAWYDKADAYVRRKRAIYEAEQAAIAEKQAAIEREKELEREKERAIREAEQAITDRENNFLHLMKESLYRGDIEG